MSGMPRNTDNGINILMPLQPVAEHFNLDGVLTLVDAKHVGQHLDEEKEAGVVNEAIAQVAYADRIILNKIDLVHMPFQAQSKKCCLSMHRGAALLWQMTA